MAARAKGICNESAHFYGATAYHDWFQKVQYDFIQRMTRCGCRRLAARSWRHRSRQDLAANFGEISKPKMRPLNARPSMNPWLE